MTDEPGSPFTKIERETLWNAVEGTHLIEIRNDAPDPGYSLDTYRSEVGRAMKRLADAGLITPFLGAWGEEATRTIGIGEAMARISDGTAWDPDQAELISIEATEEGRSVAMSL
ncbi:hypothetical protein GCM10022223_44310 [Kineosporia mesophila]|uniref:Uncharacterized protein n=1 Tax=Kineosporia mesophila TaxID=566012 RepID=A0ABP7A0S4_9ACTN|nr:hypothetical protein [Kineosporia mesophila]MCD5348855.1 hypothetical protein [Kineosporia mesophila]